MSDIDDNSRRPAVHFIVEWAKRRGVRQRDIVRDLNVDKGLVSRWFSGTMPKQEYLEMLADYFGLDDFHSLLRHPDDDWIAKFFRDKTEEQRQRAIEMLKLLFQDLASEPEPPPRKTAERR